MARPKLGESESRRLQMVITDDELEAIDTWQRANRIASRSEAIRRLVQIGIRLSDADFNKRAYMQVGGLRKLREAIESAQMRLGEAAEQNERRALQVALGRLLEDADLAFKLQTDAFTAMMSLIDEVYVLKTPSSVSQPISVEDAKKAAKAIREDYETGSPQIAVLVSHLLKPPPKE